MNYFLGQSYFNEAVNGTLMVLALFALVVFLRDIWINRRLPYTEQKAAIALTVLFMGIFIIRSCFWYARHFTGSEYELPPGIFYGLVFCGLIIQGWGILCSIRIFSPIRCTFRIWVIAILSAILWNTLWMTQYFV